MKTNTTDADQAVMMNMLKCLVNRGIVSRREAEQAAGSIASRNGSRFCSLL
jgi:hypothetical protein